MREFTTEYTTTYPTELNTILVDKEFVDSYRTPNGGYTKRFMNRFGYKWPPKRGWKANLIEKKLYICEDFVCVLDKER